MTAKDVKTKDVEDKKPEKIKGFMYFPTGHTVNFKGKITIFKPGTGYDPKNYPADFVKYLNEDNEAMKKNTGKPFMEIG